MSAEKLKVVLCWHMHQPDYRDPTTGEYLRPWSYLHAIKDYVDMAAHLESVPKARAVVNFAPVLLEQLTDYATQIAGFLDGGKPLSDPLLAQLATAAGPRTDSGKRQLIDACLRANQQRLIDRFEPYSRLAALARRAQADPMILQYLGEQFFADLTVWYHLAWMAETVRRADPLVGEMTRKATDFSLDDRTALLRLIGRLIAGVIPRYRRLAERGQVELSTSPFAHPMLPLLLDLNTARAAMPAIDLPDGGNYPGGVVRANWHMAEGLRVFEHHFGFLPSGCWPSEGGVCDSTMQLLSSHAMQWAASGESVLSNSLAHAGTEKDPSSQHRPYRVGPAQTVCFFRSDSLSDDIGFNFQTWHADDAISHLADRLESIRTNLAEPGQHVVSIILDGENAWESYPENGYHFLSALYSQLAEHPTIELTTFSKALAKGVSVASLDTLVAGSWVYGTFSTWVGEAAKNRAWDILIEAKSHFDRHAGGLPDDVREAAIEQLAVCEGSDWFWWLGDEGNTGSVQSFEQLFRHHVSRLYELLNLTPPDYLDMPIDYGSTQQVGAMRRAGT